VAIADRGGYDAGWYHEFLQSRVRRAMPETIKFKCKCGKVLAADVKFAGKKAKCGGCGQAVVIPLSQPAGTRAATSPGPAPQVKKSPAPIAAAPPASAAAKSIFDEETEYELDRPAAATCFVCGETLPAGSSACPHCGDPLSANSAAVKSPAVARRKIPTWAYFAAFGVYVVVCWLVSLMSPVLFMLLSLPVVMLGFFAFAIGALWYFLVLARDSPGEAAVLFTGFLGALFLGIRGSAVGAATGSMRRGRAANPSHARPAAVMKFGGLMLAFGIGVVLIVGIALGALRKENLRGGRFPDLPPRPQPFQQPPFPPAGPRNFNIDR